MMIGYWLVVFAAAFCTGQGLDDSLGQYFIGDRSLSSENKDLKPGFVNSKRDATTCEVAEPNMDLLQIKEVVDIHNYYRGKEPATNMIKVEWDKDLASLAQASANHCAFQHGNFKTCDGKQVGQNIFMSYGGRSFSKINLTSATKSWADEKQYWNFASSTCQTGKVCGHYTQIVWAGSFTVGCAFAQCPSVTGVSRPALNADLIFCNYSPPGNWVGQKAYKEGPSCTECTTFRKSLSKKGYKCQENLCVPCIPKEDADCRCDEAVTCQNGGTYSDATCTCDCKKGFYGDECENSCICSDTDSNCPNWKSSCDKVVYSSFLKKSCAKTCNMCDAPASCFS